MNATCNYCVFYCDGAGGVTGDCCAADVDAEGLDRGWYYLFADGVEPDGPYRTSGRAEAAAEAVIEECGLS